MSKDNGGPAFPTTTQVTQNQATGETTVHQYLSDGMTLRDYFATNAMQGLFAFWVSVNSKTCINDPDPKIIAEMSYEYADAMLKAREL